MPRKKKIPNSKHEILNKSKIQRGKTENGGIFAMRILFLWICSGFRASSFQIFPVGPLVAWESSHIIDFVTGKHRFWRVELPAAKKYFGGEMSTL
jgi:hypothetical protein